uniref:restriction endonuclease subunit S n=1 Tax=Bacillus sp. CGMCC 1.16541 TaxID=2185143 RepID=UPI000D73F21D
MSKKYEKFIDKAIVPLEEQPYELPESWQWVLLDSVGEINPRNKVLKDDDIVSFVPMASVDDKKGIYLGEEKKTWVELKKGYTHMAENDVIFAKITPCMENGKCVVLTNLVNGYGAGSTEFHVFRSVGATVPEFLHAFLRQKSFRKYAEKNMTGSAGQKRVPTKWFKNICFPLPPIEEQRRIVEKLRNSFDIIDNAKDKINHARELISRRREALFRRAFRGELVQQEIEEGNTNELLQEIEQYRSEGKKKVEIVPIGIEEYPYAIPESWSWVQTQDLMKWSSGGTPKSSVKEYYGGEIPWAVIGDLNNNVVIKTEKTITEEGFKNSSAKWIKPNAVMFAMYGASVGKMGIAGERLTSNQAIAFTDEIYQGIYNKSLALHKYSLNFQFNTFSDL